MTCSMAPCHVAGQATLRFIFCTIVCPLLLLSVSSKSAHASAPTGQVQVASGPTSETCYYVAIGSAVNKTSAEDATMTRWVRLALEKALTQRERVAVAPSKEAPARAKVVVNQFSTLQPLFLWPKVRAQTKDNRLRVELSLGIFSYPDKALQGRVSQTLSFENATADKQSSLEVLVKAASPRLVTRMLGSLDRLHRQPRCRSRAANRTEVAVLQED